MTNFWLHYVYSRDASCDSCSTGCKLSWLKLFVDFIDHTKPLPTLPSYGKQSSFHPIQYDVSATYIYCSIITYLTHEYISTNAQVEVHIVLFEQS
jgi:hypothetical protein